MSEANTIPEKPYVLRGIKAPDVYQLVRVMSKIGVVEILDSLPSDLLDAAHFTAPTMMQKGEEVEMPSHLWTEANHRRHEKALSAQSQLAIITIGLVLEHFADCEKELNTLLANSINESIDVINDMDGKVFLRLLNDYIAREEFSDFFTEALRLLSASKKKVDVTKTIDLLT